MGVAKKRNFFFLLFLKAKFYFYILEYIDILFVGQHMFTFLSSYTEIRFNVKPTPIFFFKAKCAKSQEKQNNQEPESGSLSSSLDINNIKKAFPVYHGPFCKEPPKPRDGRGDMLGSVHPLQGSLSPMPSPRHPSLLLAV